MAYTVTLLPFDRQFECEEEETVLDAALRQGIHLPYGCKHGGCGACKALIVEGEVEGDASTFALMDFERSQGLALLCSSRPLSDLAIELPDSYSREDLFEARPIRDYEASVCSIDSLTHDIRSVTLKLVSPTSIEFKAGQYMDGLVPGTTEWRSYSMASAPGSGDVEFLVKLFPGGIASSYLEGSLQIGEHVTLRGPYGNFHLHESDRLALLIAGGSGMAPILSMLRDAVQRGAQRLMTFFYGARTRRDLFYLEELFSYEKHLPGFRFIPALSEPLPSDEWSGEIGLVTEVVERKVESFRDLEAYLCGPPAMIDNAISMLRRCGVRESDIHFDKFLTKQDLLRGRS